MLRQLPPRTSSFLFRTKDGSFQDVPRRRNDYAMNLLEAAVFLGISYHRMKRLIDDGYVRAFFLPSRRGNPRPATRIRVAELERFMMEYLVADWRPTRRDGYFWNPRTASTIPRATLAKLLGIKESSVRNLLRPGGSLKDLTPASVRRAIVERYADGIRRELRKQASSERRYLLRQVRDLTRRLERSGCPGCRKPVRRLRRKA